MNKRSNILLVDDNKDDRLIMQLAFEQIPFDAVQIACDGLEAVAYLKGDGQFSDRSKFPLPTVMLLDLKMPLMDGFEVLGWVRSQPRLKRLPVFTLTSSNRPEDIERAYDLGASGFLVKPAELKNLVQMLKTLVEWIAFNEFASLT
jgi:CheY-like chemotaxis protein